MTFSASKENTAPQAQISDLKPRTLALSLTQSREIGVLIQDTQPNGASIASNEAPVAKPWAHFVAGAYGIIPYL